MKINTKYNSSFRNPQTHSPSGSFTTTEYRLGRVVDIVDSEKHPDFEKYGGSVALNGIRYRPFNRLETQDKSDLPFAFIHSSNIRHIPLVDEIVQIFIGIRYNYEDNSKTERTYYTAPLNTWNNVNHNGIPLQQNPPQLGAEIEEQAVPSLRAFQGDVIVEGRLGNFIRLSGFRKKDASPELSIGVSTEFDVFEDGTFLEGFNSKTGTLVKISSKNSVDISEQYSAEETFRTNEYLKYTAVPSKLSTYEGHQFILRSGRIVLQSSSDSILLDSKKSIALTGRSINLESQEYLALDSPYIYLGSKSKRASRKDREPVVLGRQHQEWQQEFISLLRNMSKQFQLAGTPPQASTILTQLGNILPAQLDSLEGKLHRINSKKVFTD